MDEIATTARTAERVGELLESDTRTLETRGQDAVLSNGSLERVYLFCLSSRQILTTHFGDIESGLTLMVADWAGIGGHPTDISTVSEITGISRPTIRRKLEKLEARNLVVVTRRPNRTLILPNPDKQDEIRKRMSHIAKALLGTARRLEADA